MYGKLGQSIFNGDCKGIDGHTQWSITNNVDFFLIQFIFLDMNTRIDWNNLQCIHLLIVLQTFYNSNLTNGKNNCAEKKGND